MQVVVSGRHMDVTEALQEHATQRALKACDHLVAAPANCKVVLGLDSGVHRAEFVVHHRGRDFVARSENPGDMYAAIDAASNKLRRQLDDFSSKGQAGRR